MLRQFAVRKHHHQASLANKGRCRVFQKIAIEDLGVRKPFGAHSCAVVTDEAGCDLDPRCAANRNAAAPVAAARQPDQARIQDAIVRR